MDTSSPFATIRLGGHDPIGHPGVEAPQVIALGQADRLAAVGQLAGGLAHEMNTPLGSIAARAEEALELLEHLESHPRGPDELREHLRGIIRQAHRCSRIASRLLQFARPRRVAGATCRREQLVRMVDEVFGLLDPVSGPGDVRLERFVEENVSVIPVMPADLEQVLLNLVQNAVDACQGGGVVRVHARGADGLCRLVVEDTGCGIPRDRLARIFDPFFTTKPIGQGTGLGLSVCHGIIGGAGGSIEVRSAPGFGTVVTVVIPECDASSTGSEVRDASEALPSRRDRRGPSRAAVGRLGHAVLGLGLWLLLSTAGCSRHPADDSGPAAPRPAQAVALEVKDPVPAPPASGTDAKPTGAALFNHYCATCHGETGDGNGPAARFLYPKPRSFRDGRFRIVTTDNLVPSDRDLMRVVERGMPGSAMFPLGHLPEADRAAMVEYVRELVRQGHEARFRKEAAEFGEAVDPEALAKDLAMRTKVGATIEVPRDLPASDQASVARGRELYVKSCASCHGETGKGDGFQEQRDESGVPIRPRDFTRGIFKGGRERESLYARIVLGIPGTPMPSSPGLKPAEVGDLINYIQSLSSASTPERVEHRRTRLVARRVPRPLEEVIPDDAWDESAATPIVASPLWWRDHEDPELRVQAIHDGRSLALRLSWRDATRDARAIRPQDFPDMAAFQLFRGDREPFIGMGKADGPVDVWLWNAAAQDDRDEYADVDTAYPNMAVDQYPFERPGEGPRAHPTDRQPREYLTAWAAGNLRSDPARAGAANHLQARGFGSLTMRPVASQLVRARGEWKEGRWTVVLSRPLAIAPDAGLPLAPGSKTSVAFALWNGSAGDRNGQKLVSIWHELDLD